MKRMHLKKYKKNKGINKIILIIILLIVILIYIFKIFNDKALPQFISYSEIETKKIVTSLINDTVAHEISNNINLDNLFVTVKDNNDIKNIDFNTGEVNKILSNISKVVESNLKYLETGQIDKLYLDYDIDKEKFKKGIIYELPSGIIFNNVLLNNILPKIPVKISLIGEEFLQYCVRYGFIRYCFWQWQ